MLMYSNYLEELRAFAAQQETDDKPKYRESITQFLDYLLRELEYDYMQETFTDEQYKRMKENLEDYAAELTK